MIAFPMRRGLILSRYLLVFSIAIPRDLSAIVIVKALFLARFLMTRIRDAHIGVLDHGRCI